MERKPDWEQRLNDFLADVAGKPFKAGEHDGAMFAAGAVKAMTGVDLGKQFRGSYETCDDGHAKVKKAGYANLPALLETMLPRVPKSSAQRGDVIMTAKKDLGICFGGVALCVGTDEEGEPGFARVPRELWQRAWRVG